MRTSIRRILFFLFVFGFGVGLAASLHAQPQRFRFEHVGLEDGLPGVQVRSILQDRQGFLWVGTRNGLGRYDGYGFTTYRPDPDDPHSISGRLVTALHEDRQGFLWVGTNGGGLNRFDPATGRFEHYRHDPEDPETLSHDHVKDNALYEDSHGILWVVTRRGLDRLDPATGRVRHFDLNVHDIWKANTGEATALGSPPSPPYIMEDHTGALWVATAGDGLGRFNPEAETFTMYRHDPDDPQTLISDHVTSVYEAPSEPGMLWVGTYDEATGEGGLNRFEVATGRTVRYQHDKQDPKSLSHDWVGQVHEDRAGQLWVGTCGGGINRFDPGRETFTRYVPEPASSATGGWGNPNCTPDILEDRAGHLWLTPWMSEGGAIFSLDPESGAFARYDPDLSEPNGYHTGRPITVYEDRSGILWFGGWGSSLDKLDPAAQQFRTYLHDPDEPSSLSGYGVEALHEDSGGVMWVGTANGGLNRFDRLAGTFARYLAPTSRARVDDITEDEGVLWVGTRGLYRFDREAETFSAYPRSPAYMCKLYVDREGKLWGGTHGSGLYRLDRETGTLTHFPPDPDDPARLPGSGVCSVFEDEQGTLWVTSATDPGTSWLSRYDRATGRFTNYPRPPSSPLPEPFVGTGGTFWMPSDEGVYRFDTATKRFTAVFTEDDGLPDNGVQAILEDDAGWLWIATRNGLCRFHPETREYRTFSADDGLKSNRFNHPAIRLRSGELVFGGEKGITLFDPDEIEDDPRMPAVVLTGLHLFGEPLRPDSSGPLQQSIEYADAVLLEHDQNDLTLQYVGLHFGHPEKIQYAYMLEGYEDDWREVGTQRAAIYPNLPPGDYIFRVRAANPDGVWNEAGAALSLTIHPPWWRTTWAYIFYGLLFAAGVFAADRIQRRRLIRKEREKVRERELAQAREIEAANIRLRTHEEQLEEQNARLEEQKTQIEAQARRLRELDELKSRFFANISHEFRTPLTLVLGPLRDALAGRYGAVSERLRVQLALMQQNAGRLLGLIGQLLDLSRLEAGSMHLRAQRGDLAAFLERIVRSFSSRAEREEITLQFTASPEEIVCYFDPDNLEKVALNLISNAFKFTPNHGKIRISVASSDEGSLAEIEVRDNGEGIPVRELPYIFDRFHQADTSTTRRHEGSGIGLALVKELVELHGGFIDAESTVGFGTRFTVRLPLGTEHLRPEELVEEDPETMVPPHMEHTEVTEHTEATEARAAELVVEAAHELAAGDGREHGPERPLVLIVEDNDGMRAYLRDHLEERYRVAEAADGAQALERARARRPDLVVSDVMMPGMDGFALCRALKTDEALSDVPVILLTARAGEEARLEGLEMGADDYLTKPFSAEELMARAENLIELRRMLRRRFSEEVVIGPSEVVATPQDAAFVERVRTVAEAHLGDANFTVEWLADEVGLSSRQLHRKLLDLTELTPAAYIRMMRLERAAQLLKQQAGNVSEVAYQVGFQNAKYFSRLFKQTFGQVPSEFSEDQA